MPIVAWKCPGCNGATVPLDHYATSPCGLTHVHPSFAAAVLHHDRAHYTRGTGVVEVSNGLGCPRQAGIEKGEIAVNPLEYNAMMGGTAWHEVMEQHVPADYQIEYVVKGALGMVPIQGKIDYLSRKHSLIGDWKTKTCFKAASIAKDGAEPDNVAQLSLYAALVEQQDGWRPKHGTIWYRFAAAGLKPVHVTLMSPEAVLAYKPTKNDKYTVMDLLRATDAMYQGVVKWEDLPLVGESMFFGAKTKCEYCTSRDTCWTQAKGAPF